MKMYVIVADLKNEKLFIPKELIKEMRNLGSHVGQLYWEYKNKYPLFEEVIA